MEPAASLHRASRTMNPPGRSPTTRDVAAAAGVSRATVSYALRNHPRIPAATREKIRAVAASHGYKANPLVSSWLAHVRGSRAKREVGTLAYLTQWRDNAALATPSAVRRFESGLTTRAARLGYRLDPIALDAPGMNTDRIGRILAARGIEGVVVGPLPDHRHTLELDWSRFAAATWGFSLHTPILPRACAHQPHAVLTSARALHALGRRRIGLALPDAFDTRHEHNFRAGYHVFQHNLPAARRLTPFLPAADAWHARAFLDWLRRERPDALIFNRPVIRTWLARAPAALRRDVLLADLESDSAAPSGPGFDQRPEAVGAAVIDLVVEQLNANERGLPAAPKTVLIEGNWLGAPGA